MPEIHRTAHLVERTLSRSLTVGGNPESRAVVSPISRVGLLVQRSAVSRLVSFHIPRGTHTLGYLRRNKRKTHRDSCRSLTLPPRLHTSLPFSDPRTRMTRLGACLSPFEHSDSYMACNFSFRTSEDERTQSMQYTN